MTASSAKEDDHQQDFMSLDDFLWRLPKNQLTRVGYLILMVIMANAFLHLQGGPWSTRTRDWSKAKICLPKANNQETLNTARSYLCAQCIPYNELQQSPKLDGPAASLHIHPLPSLLALGILLLEIELGRPIESQRSADHPDNTGIFNVGSDLPEVNDMLD